MKEVLMVQSTKDIAEVKSLSGIGSPVCSRTYSVSKRVSANESAFKLEAKRSMRPLAGIFPSFLPSIGPSMNYN